MPENPFEAPDAEQTSAERPAVDVHVTIVSAFLLAVGAVLSGLGVFLAGGGVLLGAIYLLVPDLPHDPGEPPPWAMPFIAFGESLFFFIPGAAYLTAAYGMFARKTWGWVLAMLGFSLTLTGCCAPFGLYGFYALLREEPRRAFGLL
jgi:hypothetical protein